jgi:DNA processing protein
LPLLAVVGSRQYTTYGKQVTERLMAQLAPYQVGIVSGLALGIDGLAHEAALKAGLYTLAVPGSGLSRTVIYPRRHQALATKIVEQGGGLLSELPPTTRAATWTFPQRNRIMAGLCQATLLIEASEKSGTLITARLAVDYNRELFAIPGSIFSPTTQGTHQFLKLGATLVTSAEDIIEVMRLIPKQYEASPRTALVLSPAARQVITLLREPRSRDELIRQLALPIAEANTLLMTLELEGHITESGGLYLALTPLATTLSPPSLFDRTGKSE